MACAVVLAGCSDSEVVSYEIPKSEREAPSMDPGDARSTDTPTRPDAMGGPMTGSAPQGAPSAPAPGAPVGQPQPQASGHAQSGMTILPGMEQSADGAGAFAYEHLPETWEEFAPSGIRIANFRIRNEAGTAEMTVLAFPGDVGGDLANLNRWRQQIGMSEIRTADLDDQSEMIDVDGRTSRLVTLQGAREGVVGAFVPTETHTWFFKLQGGNAAALLEREPFVEFMRSVTITRD